MTARIAIAMLLLGCGRAPGGQAGLVAHDAFFVVGGSHKAFGCEQCHDPGAAGFALADHGVTCVACHAAADVTPAHAGVAGFAYADATCISCHKDGSAGLPANHNTDDFPVTGTSHASVACSECHGATRAIGDITCTPCHAQAATATAHAAIPATTTGRRDGVRYTNYQWASADCLKCHADGQVDRIASHPRIDHGLTGSGHAPFCLTCHTTLSPAGGKAWSADFGKSSCLACHSSNNPG